MTQFDAAPRGGAMLALDLLTPSEVALLAGSAMLALTSLMSRIIESFAGGDPALPGASALELYLVAVAQALAT